MNKGLDVERERRSQRTNLKNNPNMPVFILDGFEVSVEKIYDMDMNRIESMTILRMPLRLLYTVLGRPMGLWL